MATPNILELSDNTMLVQLTVGQLADIIQKIVANQLELKNKQTHDSDILTQSQLSDYIGCAYNTIYQYISQGMPHSKRGKKMNVFSKIEVDEWLKRNGKKKRIKNNSL